MDSMAPPRPASRAEATVAAVWVRWELWQAASWEEDTTNLTEAVKTRMVIPRTHPRAERTKVKLHLQHTKHQARTRRLILRAIHQLPDMAPKAEVITSRLVNNITSKARQELRRVVMGLRAELTIHKASKATGSSLNTARILQVSSLRHTTSTDSSSRQDTTNILHLHQADRSMASTVVATELKVMISTVATDSSTSSSSITEDSSPSLRLRQERHRMINPANIRHTARAMVDNRVDTDSNKEATTNTSLRQTLGGDRVGAEMFFVV